MKTNQLALAAVLFTGLAALSWAGPSPSWTQPAKSQLEKKLHACPTDAASVAPACPCCSTPQKA